MIHERTRQHRRGICSCHRLQVLVSQRNRGKWLFRKMKTDPELLDSVVQTELKIKESTT